MNKNDKVEKISKTKDCLEARIRMNLKIGGNMKKFRILWTVICCLFLCFNNCATQEKSKKSENLPSDIAKYEFLRYSGGQEIFSPDKIVSSDNNWEILLSCIGGITREELENKGVLFTESQLMLLKAMGFMDFGNASEPEKLLTTLPILGFSEKQALIQKVRSFVHEIEPVLRDDIKMLKETLQGKGWEEYAFSILFSAVVDGIVWFPFRAQGFVNEFALDHSRPLFDGVYWAYYPKRHFRCGSNIAIGDDVYMILNWSDGPLKKTQEVFHWDNLYALRDEFLKHGKVADEALKSELIPYGVLDNEGDFIVPLIEMEANDHIFLICQSMAAKIVGAISQKLDLEDLQEEFGFADREKAFVVVYHEWIWEFMEHVVEQGLVRKPLAFSDPDQAGPEEIGKLFFIVRGSIS
jgi:hypothetical protein